MREVVHRRQKPIITAHRWSSLLCLVLVLQIRTRSACWQSRAAGHLQQRYQRRTVPAAYCQWCRCLHRWAATQMVLDPG